MSKANYTAEELREAHRALDSTLKKCEKMDASRFPLDKGVSYEQFFAEAPQMNPNAHKVTGVICGHRIEEINDPLMQKVRRLDKLVDELAKGRAMEKILRS
jgi:hypothetical protein